MNTIDIIKATIKEHNLIKSGDRIIIALSGGADSSCLLHALHTLKDELHITLYAAHINHNLRDNAINDQHFVENLCKELKIPCYVKSVDVADFAKKHKMSSEDAGRQIRYDFFEELSRKLDINKIATAHNKNDCTETILMNFIRGSGLSGLCGIPYFRNKKIIRPILDLSRQQIEQYCFKNGIEYVTDETNFKPIYTRNKIRLQLIPFICDNFNSSFTERVIANSKILYNENDFMEQCTQTAFDKSVKTEYGNYIINLHIFNQNHIAIKKRILVLVLKLLSNSAHSYSSKYIDNLIVLSQNNITGKSINLPNNIIARTEYNTLVLSKKTVDTIITKKKIELGKNDINIGILNISICDSAKKSSANTVYLKYDVLNDLFVRSRKNGDYFYPIGMNGKKKLKDYFIDLKISESKRNAIPLLSNSNDDIIWIVGKRVDKRFVADIGDKSIKIYLDNIRKDY